MRILALLFALALLAPCAEARNKYRSDPALVAEFRWGGYGQVESRTGSPLATLAVEDRVDGRSCVNSTSGFGEWTLNATLSAYTVAFWAKHDPALTGNTGGEGAFAVGDIFTAGGMSFDCHDPGYRYQHTGTSGPIANGPNCLLPPSGPPLTDSGTYSISERWPGSWESITSILASPTVDTLSVVDGIGSAWVDGTDAYAFYAGWDGGGGSEQQPVGAYLSWTAHMDAVGPPMDYGVWMFSAACSDAGGCITFANDREATETGVSGDCGTMTFSGANGFIRFGTRGEGGSGNWSGWVGYSALFSRKLSTVEVQRLYMKTLIATGHE